MYLVGAHHPLKARARQLAEEAIADGEALCTDVEVLQEILHRYRAINRLEMVAPAFAAVLGIVDVVYPIELRDVERARRILQSSPDRSARDAVHIAVMQAHDVDAVMSFDRGFDGIPGVRRIE